MTYFIFIVVGLFAGFLSGHIATEATSAVVMILVSPWLVVSNV